VAARTFKVQFSNGYNMLDYWTGKTGDHQGPVWITSTSLT